MSSLKKPRALAQSTLQNIELDLFAIKTNYRKIAKVRWEDAFAIALVAVLNNFKNHAGTCLIGSSEPYDELVIPWGSSPLTDHLLSSEVFTVIHDGASHSRTEKVGEISDWPVGIKNLRVCWQGKDKYKNCGQCEKCIRTKLNFLAVGAPIPECFPESDIYSDLDKIKLPLANEPIRTEYRQIRDSAIKNGISAPWVKRMTVIANKKPIIETLLPLHSTRRKIVKKAMSLFK